MHWPITIAQDKVAVDIVCTIFPVERGNKLLREIGFNHPDTGPWAWCGYYWRWGYTKTTDWCLLYIYR